ncbi:flagellar protein FlgN [Desulfovibrio sp. JY]|nr:flagellar protein FlgN [Desulfovibrio sp. JY]
MIAGILSNLERQLKAVLLLDTLQKEEFSHLSARNPGGVASAEFSIQELLRQLTVERHSLHAIYAALDPGATRLGDVIGRFSPEDAEKAGGLVAAIDAGQQRCAKQASRNYAMALGLYDVAKGSLDTLRKLLVPKKGVYGATGRMATGTSGPGIISGRL